MTLKRNYAPNKCNIFLLKQSGIIHRQQWNDVSRADPEGKKWSCLGGRTPYEKFSVHFHLRLIILSSLKKINFTIFISSKSER